jgi:mRNA interferase MazF
MGNYSLGNVVIAPVACEDRGGVKTRPAVVIGMTEKGEVYLCPVSSKPPSDAPCVSISLDDFSEGGLDLFNESYVLTSRVRMIRSGDVIGKRGQLTEEAFQAITSRVPQSCMPDNTRKKGNSHYHSLR